MSKLSPQLTWQRPEFLSLKRFLLDLVPDPGTLMFMNIIFGPDLQGPIAPVSPLSSLRTGKNHPQPRNRSGATCPVTNKAGVTTMTSRILIVLWFVNFFGLSAQAAPCPRCGWSPPETRVTIPVRPNQDLYKILSQARPGTTVLLEDGVYRLGGALQVVAPDIVLRGRSGDRSRVILTGQSMTENRVLVGISVEAPRFTLADLTVARVGHHGIQIRGELETPKTTLHNIRVIDTGQQLVKISTLNNGHRADHGLVACSRFEYSDHAPSDYTNGVDIHAGTGWVVRDNVFLNVRGPESGNWKAGPTILIWNDSRDSIVERNFVVNCYRGIALGLSPRDASAPDHGGGTIRNNVICNLNPWGDEPIEVNSCPGVVIEHNTVFLDPHLPWAISIRFPSSSALVRNNLSNRPIVKRDGAQATLEGNILNAQADWFVDPSRSNLRLTRANIPPVDAGVPVNDLEQDLDLHPRTQGRAPDAGAFEFPAK